MEALPDSVESLIAGDIDRLSPDGPDDPALCRGPRPELRPDPVGRGGLREDVDLDVDVGHGSSAWSRPSRAVSPPLPEHARPRRGLRGASVPTAARALHARVGEAIEATAGHFASTRRSAPWPCISTRRSAGTRHGSTRAHRRRIARSAIYANLERDALLEKVLTRRPPATRRGHGRACEPRTSCRAMRSYRLGEFGAADTRARRPPDACSSRSPSRAAALAVKQAMLAAQARPLPRRP